MEKKSSESTPLRPDGERVLNATQVEMDLNKFMSQIREEATWQTSDHNSITILKSDAMRIVLIGLHAGATLKRHSANAVISVQVIEGSVKFHVGDRATPLSKGQMVALHPKVPHSVEAEAESFFLLTLARVGD